MELIVSRRPMTVIGFRTPKNIRALSIVALIIVLYVVAGVLKPLVMSISYDFRWQHIVSNCVIYPYVEETLFRGVIQTRLESAVGITRSWVLSGLLFGFYHYYHYYLVLGKIPDMMHIVALIAVSVFGMLFGVIFARTRSLLPSFLLHGVNNLFAATPW
jgi:membrane protease YdiL (CAAX protease family)